MPFFQGTWTVVQEMQGMSSHLNNFLAHEVLKVINILILLNKCSSAITEIERIGDTFQTFQTSVAMVNCELLQWLPQWNNQYQWHHRMTSGLID